MAAYMQVEMSWADLNFAETDDLCIVISHSVDRQSLQVIAASVTTAEGSQLKKQIQELKLSIEKLLI